MTSSWQKCSCTFNNETKAKWRASFDAWFDRAPIGIIGDFERLNFIRVISKFDFSAFPPYLNPRLRRRKSDIAPCQIRLLLGRTSHLTFTSGELSRKVGVALARVNQQHFRPGPIVANFNIGIELFDLEFFRAFFDPINVKVSVLWAEIGNKIVKSVNTKLQETDF